MKAELFKKILIANRGEIAVRIAKTCRKHGVTSVGVYSDADVNSYHVGWCDESHYIGGSEATKSYLNANKLIEVAKKTQCEAIHPGYGFLSESPDFAQICKQSGITFIGPPINALNKMASKYTSKLIMQEANVPTIPGILSYDSEESLLKRIKQEVGFPVLAKAAMGGGGKGMKLIMNEEMYQTQMDSAKREAQQAFKDSQLIIEKFIGASRHIEVQIFGDTQGNILHLFERDCSVQRRHQKILEEAPAEVLTDEIRQQLYQAAVNAGKAVGYVGAGTVEFLYDINQQKFYFMEMNTRLQVEHPVTEMITGLDLVYLQLLVAKGYPLPYQQKDIKRKGHAMEARIYAEDPTNNFLPAFGQIKKLQFPLNYDFARVDTGIREKDQITVFYDPMIAKLIVWGENRTACIVRMLKALSETQIVGIANNVNFLRRICLHRQFEANHYDTNFIKTHESDLQQVIETDSEEHMMIAALYKYISKHQQNVATNPWNLNDSFLVNQPDQRTFLFDLGEVKLSRDRQSNIFTIISPISKQQYKVKAWLDSPHRLRVYYIDEKYQKSYSINLRYHPDKPKAVSVNSNLIYDIPDLKFQELLGSKEGTYQVSSKIPATVNKVLVQKGQIVEEDQPLVILYAMKMEMILKAPVAGNVQSVFCEQDQFVNADQPLIVIGQNQ